MWREVNMRNTKMVSLSRVKLFCIGTALMLIMLVAAPTTAAHAQSVFVPGNASGYFGNPVDQAVPFVSALTVSGPGRITVTYVSGLVTLNSHGDTTGPNGTSCDSCKGMQFPLHEARGSGFGKANNVGALIGVFVPQSRVLRKGFSAIDGTKDALRVGVMPGGLFLIGEGKTFDVTEAGTLFLGINDTIVGDNSGGFNVTVAGP
jgi:hypothetical protein